MTAMLRMTLLCCLLLAACAPEHDGFGYKRDLHPMDMRNYTDRLIDHEQPDWDRAGLWRRVGTTRPLVFAPKEMPKTAPVDDGHGSWTVDAADGSRFFVPHGGTRNYSETLLKAEAHKMTNHVGVARHRMVNALGVLVFWPLGVAGSAAQSIQLP
jgi:hypothetical protein